MDRNDRARDLAYERIYPDVRRDTSRTRGPAHLIGFTDRVMEHQFPDGFKPINIESYDNTRGAKEYLQVLAVELSIQPHPEN